MSPRHERCAVARCRSRATPSCLRGAGAGIVQFAAPKGALPRRTIGWIWVVLMATMAASSFEIHQLRLFGPWSPIHLLSIMVLVLLPIAVISARRHHVGRHRNIMIGIFSGGLVVAGLFTLLPGRMMHAMIFGHY